MNHKQLQWLLSLMALCQIIAIGKMLLSFSDVSVQTMPILTPVSLDYERALHMVMDAARHVDQTRVSKKDYEHFVADRLRMLELRNQRHALNVRLMEAGVSILEELMPKQWEFVQSQRDSIQAIHEADAMEELLKKWSQ